MQKDNFQTQYRKPVKIKAQPGSREKVTYGPVYDEKGHMSLEVKGTENIYDYIQSFKDSVDINVIMKRYVNGETDVLSKVQGFYGDVTGMPSTFAQTLNMVNDGKTLFESLPVETRAEFNHNFNEFMSSVMDGTLMERIGHPSPADDQGKGEPVSPSPAEV